MRVPHVRFTIRRLMVAVAAIGVCLALFRVHFVLGMTAAGLCALAFSQPSEARFYLVLLKCLIGYGLVCMATIPFMNRFWLGEIPVLALIPLPKITFADWLRTGVVMEAIKALGLSRGRSLPTTPWHGPMPWRSPI